MHCFNNNNIFRYKWGGKGSSTNPCSEIYGGSRAFSEPESKALAVSIILYYSLEKKCFQTLSVSFSELT